VSYRGLETHDLDLDALLARRPEVAIVDDLAHANPPGSRHSRRHQDVQALLDAGIGVVTACDVQHVEGLNDMVAHVAGFEERETVADALLDQASELVALDLPLSDYLQRIAAGGTRPVRAALGDANVLGALRELMLRETAEHARGPQVAPPPALPGAGRVMVALSSLSPRAATLLRRGSRFAGRLNTAWFVIYVETPHEAPERMSPQAEQTLLANVALARELGAEVVRLKARDPVPALIDFGRAHGVAHILIGRSRRRTLVRRPPGGSWLDIVRGSLDQRLLQQARDFDVYVIAQDEGGA
jgi:two-component system sensor histidine kinase KdpD